MRDFISIELRTRLPQVEVHEKLSEALPAFSFRMGDSDANGPYISGIDGEQAQVKVWLGEDPAGLTVSFRGWRPGAPDRDEAKKEIWGTISEVILPRLGEVLRIEERD